MRLTAENAVPFLVERRLVDARSIVEGDLRIEDVSRRNRNLRVRGARRSCFLKQAHPGDEGAAITVRHEASLYRRVFADPRFAPLRPHLPAFLLFDERLEVLV